MKTLSRTFAIITGLVAGLVWPAAASEGSSRDDQNSSDSSARFGATACRLPQDGHVQFMNGSDPFRGAAGGGSYGEIFFAGGGTRITSKSGSAAAASNPSGAARGATGSAPGSREGSGPSAGPSPSYNGGPAAPTGNGGTAFDRIDEHFPGLDDRHFPANVPTGDPDGRHRGDGPGDGPKGRHHKGPGGGGDPVAAATPEPGGIVLFGTSLVGLLASRFRRNRRKA